MKLSNFKVVKEVQTGVLKCDTTIYAQVDCTTGILWWKQTQVRTIFKEFMHVHWRFMDTGEFTPEYQAENLYNAWYATENYIKAL